MTDSAFETTTSRVANLVEELNRLGRRLGLASTLRNKLAAELAGMHPTDWLAIDLLGSVGPSSIGDLGRHLDLSPAAATGLVDRLESSRLTERRADPRDRRRVTVQLTSRRPAGSKAFIAFDSELRSAMAEHACEFTEEELRVVARFLAGASSVLERTVSKHRS